MNNEKQEKDIGYLLGAFDGFDKRFMLFTDEIRNELKEMKKNFQSFISTHVTKTEFLQVTKDVEALKSGHREFNKRQESFDRRMFKWGVYISIAQVFITLILLPIGLFATQRVLGHWIDTFFK